MRRAERRVSAALFPNFCGTIKRLEWAPRRVVTKSILNASARAANALFGPQSELT